MKREALLNGGLIKTFCIAVAVAGLNGCAGTDDAVLARPVLVMASGERICGRHGVTLTTADAFGSQGAAGANTDFMSRYPNRIPDGVSLQKDAEFAVPRRISYCPKCESEYHTALKRRDDFPVPQSTGQPLRGGRWR